MDGLIDWRDGQGREKKWKSEGLRRIMRRRLLVIIIGTQRRSRRVGGGRTVGVGVHHNDLLLLLLLRLRLEMGLNRNQNNHVRDSVVVGSDDRRNSAMTATRKETDNPAGKNPDTLNKKGRAESTTRR
jgi:hypothetical protein